MDPAQALQGGFDCDFVEKPPKAVQSECPVCLLVLREPWQTICCGKSYCRVCIEQLKADKNVCPCCKKDIKDYPNIGLQQSLYDFKVYCVNKNQGCQWTGELRQLDEHINSIPSEEQQLEGCQFVQLECLYCNKNSQRSIIDIHQRQLCPRRPFSCKYCKEFDSDYKDVSTNHWPVCGYYPVQCPNRCGGTLQRQNVKSHIANHCPLHVIECDFSHAGCEVKLPRKDMPAHLHDNVVVHMSLQAASYRKVIVRLDEENKQLGKKVEKLTHDLETQTKRVVKLEGDLEQLVTKLKQNLQLQQIYIPLCPIEFTMTNFELQKRNNDYWYSGPFYTHLKGYKLCIKVQANGDCTGKGTHVSVYVCVKRGEFDDQLQWPFRGTVTIQLLVQVGDAEQTSKMVVCFDCNVKNGADSRVTEGDHATAGRGSHRFLAHANLKPKYLHNDCLKFHVKYTD